MNEINQLSYHSYHGELLTAPCVPNPLPESLGECWMAKVHFAHLATTELQSHNAL